MIFFVAIGLFFSAWITRLMALLLDAKASGLTVVPKLLLVSTSPPAAYLLFQTALFGALGGLGKMFGTARGRDELLIDPVLFLWFFGALCAALMAIARHRSNPSSPAITSRLSNFLMAAIIGAAAAALLLPIGMSDWIATGRTGPLFIVLAIGAGLAAGFLPIAGLAILLSAKFGAPGLQRALLAAPVVVGAIAIGAFAWHHAVVGQLGAWTIWPVAASALFGVLVGCGIIRQALRADGNSASAA